MLITDHSKPIHANRCYEGWSDQLSREAAANKRLRLTLFGRTRVRRTQERCWQPVLPSRQTQFRFDPLNRVTDIADAAHGVTKFTYDGNGNLLTVTDAKNQSTAYTYDTMDRLATRTDALNRQESYQYDFNGNLTQFTDRKTQISQFGYDALNRRTSASYQDGSTVSFTYDAVGRLSRTADSLSGPIDFAYDTLDRLTLELTGLGALAYQYDAISRRSTMTVAGQAPVGYQYDAASRLTQVAQGALTVGLGYDSANRRTSLTYPNNTSATYTYDNASRLTGILHQGPGGTTVENLTYTYDTGSNRTSLTRANGSASLLPAVVASATYDAANEQMQFGGATLTYDANGSLTNDGTNTYTWDVRNRLTGISGGTTASFVYDPLGRRTSKTISGVNTQFIYDGNDIVQDLANGAVTASYLRSLNIDELFGILRQDGVYFSIYDGLGSTLALTNQAASSIVQYSYEPFGKTQSSNPGFANPFQFTGRENDGTGLYYFRSRYHAPIHGRFASEDSIRLASLVGLGNLTALLKEDHSIVTTGLNLYAYVSDSPVNFTDPLGHAQRGKQNIEVNLPDGRTLNKKSDLKTIENAIKKANDLGWSQGTKDSLKALRKVVARGGTLVFVFEFLDPDEANAFENQLLCDRGIIIPACQPSGSKSNQ